VRWFFVILFLSFVIQPGLAVDFSDYLDSLIASHWTQSGFEATWEPIQGSTPPSLPENAQFRLVSSEPVRWQGPMVLVFQADTPDGRKSQFSLRGVLRVFGPALLPCRIIHQGEVLSEESVKCETIEWTNVAGTPVVSVDDLSGKVAARTLVPARPVLREHIREESIVQSGQEIYVEAVAGNVRARLRARTLEKGARGETIRVLLPTSSQPMKVRIQDEQTAQIIE
jgi:flagella basal body P-ring formation protein FlgA